MVHHMQLRGAQRKELPGYAVNVQIFTVWAARRNYARTFRNPTIAASPTLLKILFKAKFIGARYQ